MTDQNMIPAEKVRELIEHFEGKDIGIESYGIIGRFRALLPAPPQPTTGLLGRWAKDSVHGDVLVTSDCADSDGEVWVRWIDETRQIGVSGLPVPLSSLTFPEQATKPEDVPAGEAWLVEQLGEGEQRAFKTAKDEWQTSSSNPLAVYNIPDDNITLISPLTPERPLSDLQAKYDALEDKYREAQERIKTLEQPSTPRTVTTEAEYAALPEGSMIVDADDDVWRKVLSGNWIQEMSYQMLGDAKLSGTTRTVLRSGWGDEQPDQPAPVWRIEHDHKNLRAGEYIIDIDDDDGTVTKKDEKRGWWLTDSMALGNKTEAPFIVFSDKDAATTEAIAEAKRARDKETGE